MRLEHVAVTPGGSPGTVRLTGTVTYETGTPSREDYWYEVPDMCRDGLSTSGNPWLVALLPLAMTIGEPLHVSLPVDEALLGRCRRVMEIWAAWYPDLQRIPIETPVGHGEGWSPERTGLFYSGGVDSFFSLLRHQNPDPAGYHTTIDDLILIWGADIPLDQPEAFARMRQRYGVLAAEMGKTLVHVATNLRETRWNTTAWANLSHGAFLASVGLSLERRYRRLLVASSIPISHSMGGWGSHPMVDPLFSTDATEIVYDAMAETRDQKVEALVHSELALTHLRVCWRSGTDRNCGECIKCLRTMIALEIHGGLEACTTFPDAHLDLAKVARIYAGKSGNFRLFRRLSATAWLHGRMDIVRALDRALGRSIRLGTLISMLEAYGGPGSWRAREFLLRNSIHQ